MRRNSNVKSSRGDRLASEYKKAIYEIITQKLKNPLISEMVSITDVDLSPDMSHAKVYISIFSLNEEKKKITFNEIARSAKTIRYELAHSVRSKYVPELHFVTDGTMEYGDKMDKLFLKIDAMPKSED